MIENIYSDQFPQSDKGDLFVFYLHGGRDFCFLKQIKKMLKNVFSLKNYEYVK